MTRAYCFLCRAQYKTHPGLGLFRFPNDDIECSSWFDAIKKPKLPKYTVQFCHQNLRLCSIHFDQNDIRVHKKKKTLILGAKPTSTCSEDVVDMKPNPFLIKPFGDDLLRVCRTCFRIMKIEEAVPLISPFVDQHFVQKNELYTQLKELLRMDLFPVENPCLCKKCEKFINAVHTFMTTCRANEEVLKDHIDWDHKTLNLLHVVDQDELKAAYDQITEANPEEGKGDSDLASELSATWTKQGERENRLSDTEDQWCNTDNAAEEALADHDYTSTTPTSRLTSLTKKDDLFSPNFERAQKRVSQRARKRCKRYHNTNEGAGRFGRQFYGKIKTSKGAYNSHMKIHKSKYGFRCAACNKMLFECTCYLLRRKSVRGAFKYAGCPKRYMRKKRPDTHLQFQVENSKYATFRRRVALKRTQTVAPAEENRV